jgi:hypothetical protein
LRGSLLHIGNGLLDIFLVVGRPVAQRLDKRKPKAHGIDYE